MPFTDGSAIKITISAYYNPLMAAISTEPVLNRMWNASLTGKHTTTVMIRVDNQLEKAKEVLKELMK